MTVRQRLESAMKAMATLEESLRYVAKTERDSKPEFQQKEEEEDNPALPWHFLESAADIALEAQATLMRSRGDIASAVLRGWVESDPA